ncbi:MAG: NADH-quinone oxidoreductase subunit NuoN, partial [Gammaproteobacteria bacterium]|nr:NADH-quinone oxidoreductase subunit NuoN [Gammaproteobacteria bacterium]
MLFAAPDFLPAAPELFVLGMACLILVLDAYLSQAQRWITYSLSQLTLFGAALLTLMLHQAEPSLTFNDSFIRDAMGGVLKLFIYLVTGLVFIYSREYLKSRDLYRGEYFALALFAVLGMMVLVSAHSLLTLYLGLELLSLSLYSMVALQRDSASASEAAMKYFVLGAIASGMLLYGMSILYGVTGSLDLAEISRGAAQFTPGEAMPAEMPGGNTLFIFGLVFVIIGIAFKLGAVPFHMWIPDVYHGAPTAVTLFLGSAPKIAAFAMIMRLLAEGLGALHGEWQTMLIILSVLSMAAGNIIAIAQGSIKRMLAYSTIAHVGFLLLGILNGTLSGYGAAMFYTLVYTLMSAGGFGMILLLSRAGFEADRLEDFKGLNQRSPWYAFMMLLLMFSMAGVPPTVGFFAKLVVLQAAVEAGLIWLAGFAVLMSVIGAYYYLRIVKLMYFDKAEQHTPLSAPRDMRIALSLNGLGMLTLYLGLELLSLSLYSMVALQRDSASASEAAMKYFVLGAIAS